MSKVIKAVVASLAILCGVHGITKASGVAENSRLMPELVKLEARIVKEQLSKKPKDNTSKRDIIWVRWRPSFRDKNAKELYDDARSTDKNKDADNDYTHVVGCIGSSVMSTDRLRVYKIVESEECITIEVDLMRPRYVDGAPGIADLYFAIDLKFLRSSPSLKEARNRPFKKICFHINNWLLEANGLLVPMSLDSKEIAKDFEIVSPR